MRILSLLTLLFIFTTAYSQETLNLKTKFKVYNTYGESIMQKVTSTTDTLHRKGETVFVQKEVYVDGVKTKIITKDQIVLKEDIVKIKKDTVDCTSCPSGKKAFVKFKEDKIFVNYYLGNGVEQDGTYFYMLKNREYITLKHNGLILSALTIPLKYRFGTDRRGVKIEEEFSASFNLNLMLSYVFCGRTSFTYLKNTGNSIRDHSWSVGAFVGASPLTLNMGNTKSAGQNQLGEDTELKKGIFSTGIGINYRFNSLGAGVFIGYDYALGQNASDLWDYDSKPWLGFSLGIDILKLGSASSSE